MNRRCLSVAAISCLLLALGYWLSAETIRAGQAIKCTVIGADDDDGDALTFEWQWSKRLPDETWEVVREVPEAPGVLQTDGTYTSTDTLPADLTAKGQVWRVRIRAYDGEEYSTPLTAEWTIHGWPPNPPTGVLLEPVE